MTAELWPSTTSNSDVAHLAAVVFAVRGIPAPQGSKRAFRNQYTGRIQVREDSSRVKGWRSDVQNAAEAAMGRRAPFSAGPVQLTIEFRFPRPKSHRTARGALSASAPRRHHAQQPDLSKLIRAVEDALTTIVWHDDAQVAVVRAWKRWDDERPAGATIRVEALG